MTVLTIRQGEDCTLVVGDLFDAAGQRFDPTGWAIQAMVRPSALSSVLWQEWSSSPSGSQGAARIVDATVEVDGEPVGVKEVELNIAHTMSSAWTWAGQTAVLHVEATEPTGEQRRARVGDARIYLDPEAVRP